MKKYCLFLLASVALISCSSNQSDEFSSVASSIESVASSKSEASSSESIVSSQEAATYSITYNLDGGTNAANNPSNYVTGSTFSFLDPTKEGYEFTGWFDNNGKRIMGITPETTGNLILNARWTPNQNALLVTSEDDSKGTVAITSGSGYSDESITVKATPAFGYLFAGWYHFNSLVSTSLTYTFTMPKEDHSLVAHFAFDEAAAEKYAMKPVLSKDGKTMTYGLYPQKNVNDASLLSALNRLTNPESNGWYLYQETFYAKVSAKPRQSGYKFDNGTTIVEGTTYWFKCEPIQWNILNVGKGDYYHGEYYLLSSLLLDAHCFYRSQEERVIENETIYPNNYKYSDIRTWLNDDFYNTAFAFSKSFILTSEIDNSGATTESVNNWWTCEDTEDKVFLPSYQDYLNSDYGFSSSTDSLSSRQCKTTDWARASGVYYYKKLNPYYSPYWTRSPNNHNNSIYTVWDIDSRGSVAFSEVHFTAEGVRPSVYLKAA